MERIIALDEVKVEFAMLRTPEGNGEIEPAASAAKRYAARPSLRISVLANRLSIVRQFFREPT